MDIFCEEIIKRKFSAKDAGILLLCLVGAVVILLLPMIFTPLLYFFIFILAGVGFGLYYLITSIDWEFEYSITNGDFTCDKIIHRRKRKPQFSINLHDTEEIGKYDPQKFTGRKFDYVYRVGRTVGGTDGEWYLAGHYGQYGRLLGVFSPSDKVLNAIHPFIKRTVDTSALPKPQAADKPAC